MDIVRYQEQDNSNILNIFYAICVIYIIYIVKQRLLRCNKLDNTKIKKKHTFSKLQTKMLIRRYTTKIKISDKKLQNNINKKIKKLHNHYNKIIINLKKDFDKKIKNIILITTDTIDNNNNLKIYFDEKINKLSTIIIDINNLKELNKPKPVYKRWLEYDIIHNHHTYENMQDEDLINTLIEKWSVFRDSHNIIHAIYSDSYYTELYFSKILDICKNIEFTDTPLSLIHIHECSNINCNDWDISGNGMIYNKCTLQINCNPLKDLARDNLSMGKKD
jgi:hypothetical protein